MARKVRVEFAGAVCHVLDRGDRREAIFRDDADRERFLTTLGEACARTGWRVPALVLMSNHYHLLLADPAGQSGGGDALVCAARLRPGAVSQSLGSDDMDGAFQPTAPAQRASFSGALQCGRGGSRGRGARLLCDLE